MLRRIIHIVVLAGFLFAQVSGAVAMPSNFGEASGVSTEQVSPHLDCLDISDAADERNKWPASECPSTTDLHCGVGVCLILPVTSQFGTLTQNIDHLFVVHESGLGQKLMPDLRPPRV